MLQVTSKKVALLAIFAGLICDTYGACTINEFDMSFTDGTVISNAVFNTRENGNLDVEVTLERDLTEDDHVRVKAHEKGQEVIIFDQSLCELFSSHDSSSNEAHAAAERGGTPMPYECPKKGVYKFHDIDLSPLGGPVEHRYQGCLHLYIQPDIEDVNRFCYDMILPAATGEMPDTSALKPNGF